MQPEQKIALRKRGFLIGAGIVLFLVGVGTVSVLAAVRAGGSVVPRILLLFIAATCFALPAWAGFAMLRRKMKTGHYLPTPEERAATRAKTVLQLKSPKYRTNMRALYSGMTLFWIGIGAFWIRGAIRNPEKRLWAAYWVTLAIVNVIWMVRVARKPPFGVEPRSGAGTAS